ncbi:MAG: nitronate monooxygenase [Firmicutes bacterium]|nr:nitronate monooxygenase [Bacillota bacterium]
MAVKISTAPLAAAVANCGGIGVIAGTGMSVEELRQEIQRAKEMVTGHGALGVNVLFAATAFADLVKTAIAEGIDLVFSGAGISRDMYTWGREKDVPVVPIVSTGRLAVMAEKMGASAVVVEGKEAGGHLGTDRPLREILQEVVGAVKIPVIAAGGIVDGEDVKEMLDAGADGVQMGTRFAATHESNASSEFKELYVRAGREDVVLVDSPVGLKGRGLYNPYYARVNKDGAAIEQCIGCLKRCSQRFCIMDALTNAHAGGDFNNALIFSGERVDKIKQILSVREIFADIITQLT